MRPLGIAGLAIVVAITLFASAASPVAAARLRSIASMQSQLSARAGAAAVTEGAQILQDPPLEKAAAKAGRQLREGGANEIATEAQSKSNGLAGEDVVGSASEVMAAAALAASNAGDATKVDAPPVNSKSTTAGSGGSFPAKCGPRPVKPKLDFNADCMHMTSHEGKAHGRFNCPLRCPAETPLAPDGKSCECGPCWMGVTCQTPKCAHGEEVGCPNHAKHCHHSERVCLCLVGQNGKPHFTGIHCQTKFEPAPPPVITAPKVDRLADKKAEKCANAPKCKGLSVLNKDTCKCGCMPPWIGEECDQCPKCEVEGMVADKDSNCVCACANTCENEGYPDEKSCKCNCVNNFSGPNCSKCKKIKCHNGGEFNEDLCACLCPKGWTGNSCNECDEATVCENGGELDVASCKCKCNAKASRDPKSDATHWEGDFCEACTPAPFVDCGAFEFDTSTCRCTKECSGDIECKNGGLLDPKTCECKCNNGVNVTDPHFLRDARRVEGVTFFGGDQCEVCQPPKGGCPGGRPFDGVNCTCVAECKNAPLCSGPDRSDGDSAGEGILNNDTCTCDCAPGWGGADCSKVADGSERSVAAVSCQAAMTVIDEGPNGPARSGVYWINPSGTDPVRNAFQANCDMSIPGQGWTMLGDVNPDKPVTSEDYLKGRGSSAISSFHIIACDEFSGLDGADTELKNVVVRITIGNVTDFFRPRRGATLCDMLTSQNKHQWWAGGDASNVFKTPSEVAGSDQQGLSESSAFIELEEDPDDKSAEGKKNDGREGDKKETDDRDQDSVKTTDDSSKDSEESDRDIDGKGKDGGGDEESGEKDDSGSESGDDEGQDSDKDADQKEENDGNAEEGKDSNGNDDKGKDDEDNQRNSGSEEDKNDSGQMASGEDDSDQESSEDADAATKQNPEYEWVTPTYVQDPALSGLLGGCNRSWSEKFDGRTYISFWGGNNAEVNGGCCFESSKWFKAGVCSHNEDVLCFDDAECKIDAGEGNGDGVVCKSPSSVGWGKRAQIHLREILQV